MPRCPKCGNTWGLNPNAAANLPDPRKAGKAGWTPERREAQAKRAKEIYTKALDNRRKRV